MEPKTDTPVIFLDIDGVLNCEDAITENYGYGWPPSNVSQCTKSHLRFHEPAIKNLKNLLEATSAAIVLSSSWRELLTVWMANEMLTCYGLPKVIIDFTPIGVSYPWTSNASPMRSEEIREWLTNHNNPRYVALDDDDFDFTPDLHLVHVDRRCGLSEEDVKKAISFLV